MLNYETENSQSHFNNDCNDSCDFHSSGHDVDEREKEINNRIAIDEQNLEKIRIEAARLSLPLLTALCSDRTLVRCLSNRHNGTSE